MRIGMTLPQFSADTGRLRAVVAAAEEAGIDGVFVFDHLWPIGQPDGEVLLSTPLLGFLAAVSQRVSVGSLVARVGVVPDAVMVQQFRTLHRMLGDRLIAGIGTGDHLSAAENRAFGIPYPPAGERLAAASGILDRLRDDGIHTWFGGRSAAVRRIATTHADALNVWAATPDEVAAEGADAAPAEVTWGGQVLIGDDPDDAAARLQRHGHRTGLVHGTVSEVGAELARLARAGATWAVCAPLDVGDESTPARIVAAARAAAVETGDGDGAAVH